MSYATIRRLVLRALRMNHDIETSFPGENPGFGSAQTSQTEYPAHLNPCEITRPGAEYTCDVAAIPRKGTLDGREDPVAELHEAFEGRCL